MTTDSATLNAGNNYNLNSGTGSETMEQLKDRRCRKEQVAREQTDVKVNELNEPEAGETDECDSL